MPRFDGIIIGGGHNGLTCAAYLARAGLTVAVVERNGTLGGGCITEEVTLPGFKHNLHANFHLFTDGPVQADLQLDRYGLAYLYPEVQNGIAFADGTAVCISRDPERTAASFARFNEADADRYRELHDKFCVKARDFVVDSLFSAPLPADEIAARVSGPIAEEFLSYGRLGLYEAVDQNFEDERIRCLFKSFLHAMTLEDRPALGAFFPRLISRLVNYKLVKGGSSALIDALAHVITDAGGTLVTGAHVEEILVDGGRAAGVRLADGEELHADRFVASGVDVVQTVELAGDHFDAAIRERVDALSWAAHSLVTVHVALEEPPDYEAAAVEPDINEAYNLFFGLGTSEELAACFDTIRRGELPERLHGNGSCNTLFDPSYAPPGKHVAFWWPFAPYALDGDPAIWDERREEVTKELLEQWRTFAPNMTEDNVLASFLFTPLDIERTCITMRGGSHHGIAYLPDQMGANRPLPELSGYRTPIDGLYLCGFTSHSGGAITGSPGYNCANAITEDFEVDRWWTPLGPPEWHE